MAFRKMLVEDWIKVKNNPIQRDTEKHALKAKHLLTPHPTHSFVFAAELPDGKLIKLDGHTRALLWKRKDVIAPLQVQVGIIPCKDKEEAEQLYKDFDSRDALETQRDKIYGAFGRHSFEPQSGLVQGGNLTAALRIAYRVLNNGTMIKGGYGGGTVITGKSAKEVGKTDVYSMVDEFSYELHALDGYGLGQGQASSGIVAAFLISYRKHGHKVTPFWGGVFANKGSKIDGQMDAIQAITELVLSRRGNYGGSASYDLCARALGGVEKWLKDDMLSRIPSPIDMTAYLVGYEKPSERLIKAADIGKKK